MIEASLGRTHQANVDVRASAPPKGARLPTDTYQVTSGRPASGAALQPVELSTPPSARALTLPPTQRTLRRYVVRGFALLGLSGVLVVVFAIDVSFFDTPDTGIRTAVGCGLGGGTLFVFAIGLCTLFNAIRMTIVLSRRPWVPWDSQYREVDVAGTPNGQPTLYLGANGEHVLSLVALRRRWTPLAKTPEVWLCGSTRRGGVVSTPGGDYVVWCRRPIMKAVRNWLIRKGKKDGVGRTTV